MKEQELNNQKNSATPQNMMIGLLFLLITAFIISFFSLWANHIQLKSEFESFSKVVLLKLDKIQQGRNVMDNSVGRMDLPPEGEIEKAKKAPQSVVKQIPKPLKDENKGDILPIAAKVERTELAGEIIPRRVITHIVSDGESLDEICKQYQVDIKDVSEFNDIENPDRLSVGELISIPLK